ncbi:hypothetical protein QVD17_14372 [Tagetes erecta]|uniref:Uncharacterized protein n=1 Tax=Tagetes erecta TaxID=13708 RepID=A0AAD8L1N4_TARER|nr:hypothetical protein QVD17_14372 [Tagetes erecta]
MPKCKNTNGAKLSFNIRFCGECRKVIEEIVERSCVDRGDIAPFPYGYPDRVRKRAIEKSVGSQESVVSDRCRFGSAFVRAEKLARCSSEKARIELSFDQIASPEDGSNASATLHK